MKPRTHGLTIAERVRALSEEDENGCWIWTAFIDKRGYARIDTTDGEWGGHRASYAAFVGPIPEDMTVDHLCFVTSCVNPDHLRLLPWVENARNQRSALKTHCVNGHEFTPENTYLRPVRYREGKRDCRTCIRDRVRRYQSRKTAVADRGV